MENNRDIDDAKCARRFSDYCGDVTAGKCSSKYPCPVTASKEARKAAFDKRRSKRMAAVVQEVDFGESPESKSKSVVLLREDGPRGCMSSLPMEVRLKLGEKCHVYIAHLFQLLLLCKKLVFTIPPAVVRPSVDGLRIAVSNAVYTMDVLPYYNLYAMSYTQRLTIKAAVVSTLVHVPDSSQSTVTRSSYHCLLRVRRLLKLGVQKANLAHSCLYYIDPPKYWKKSFNIPFFLKPATLVYKSSFPKDVMFKALKEYEEAQDAQMVTKTSSNDESIANQTSDDVSGNPLLNSYDLKPLQSVVNEIKVPSLEGVGKKRSTSALAKAPTSVSTDSDTLPAPKRTCHSSSVQATKAPMAVATDSDSPPAAKRRCQNKAPSHQLSPPNVISRSNKTGQYQPVSSPLLKSLSAASAPQGQTIPEPTTEPTTQPSVPVSESPMCTQERIDSTENDQSPQGLVVDSDSLPIPIPTFRQEKPARVQLGEKQSSIASYFALCKEARKASFDKRRSLHIAAALAAEKEKSSADAGSESEVDDSDDYSDSDEEESSDEEYDDSPDVKINEDTQQEEKHRIEKRQKLQLQASSFLLQLTKCLSTCKKDVYTLSPNFVKPNVSKLREAVDNALYVAERIKRVSARSAASLKQLTQSATTVARLVHIPDSMHSTATKSSYHCLLRIRRFLNLSIRVATVLHAYTEKIASDIAKSKSKRKIKMTLSDFAREADGRMEVAEHHKQPNTEKTTTHSSSSAHWKAFSKAPFSLKPPTLVFDSSIHKEVLLNSMKKKLESLPPVQNQEVQMVEPTYGQGKECNFDETCRDLHDTLVQSDQKKPEHLVVSVSLHKLSSLKRMGSTVSVLPNISCPPPAKRRARDASRQFILDDVVDVGVVQGKKDSRPSRGPDYDPGVGEMINDFLWKVRREVVEKQRNGILNGVKKQSTFKSSCKKRYSPYAAKRSSSSKALSYQKEQTMKSVISKTRSLACEPKRKIEYKHTVTSSQSEKMKPPSPNKAPSKSLKVYHGTPCPVASVPKPADKGGLIVRIQIQKQPHLSMDELADLVEKKCYPITITESLSERYTRLSFKDPRQYELTSSVIPRDQYPGLLLQDGGVKFVLRASPLTPVLFQRMMEGRDMNILPKHLLSAAGPQVAAAGVDESKQPGHKISQSVASHCSPSSFSSPPMQSFNAVIKDAMDAVVKKRSRAHLKSTRRRLHPTLSNELAARKNPQVKANPVLDREEYGGIVGSRVEMNPSGSQGEEQPRKRRLGKRNATAAGLPIPAAK